MKQDRAALLDRLHNAISEIPDERLETLCAFIESVEWKAAHLISYAVVVGNVGTVHTGTSESEAQSVYDTYVEKSKMPVGRCAGESVYLMADGEPVQEYHGPADDEDETEASK